MGSDRGSILKVVAALGGILVVTAGLLAAVTLLNLRWLSLTIGGLGFFGLFVVAILFLVAIINATVGRVPLEKSAPLGLLVMGVLPAAGAVAACRWFWSVERAPWALHLLLGAGCLVAVVLGIALCLLAFQSRPRGPGPAE